MNKKILLTLTLILTLSLGYFAYFWNGKTFPLTDKVMAAGSEEKFNYLSSQTNSFCGLQATSVDSFNDGDSIRGACCDAMDLHRYKEQVEGLKKYSKIDVVPEDPYDIPTALAKRLFDYQKNIKLDSKEQKVYVKAMEMSEEGGPCCCKCWRWTAFEGQAKYLISEKGYTSEQIAEIWELEDGCGDSNHINHA